MGRVLVVLSVAWPLLLAGGAAARARGDLPALAGVVYLAGSRICHQRPERTFHTADVPWPVCGRCSGLYLAAPFGALAAGVGRGRRGRPGAARVRRVLALAALPTAATMILEWLAPAAVSTAVRALAALPLGAAVAWAIVGVAAGPSKSIG